MNTLKLLVPHFILSWIITTEYCMMIMKIQSDPQNNKIFFTSQTFWFYGLLKSWWNSWALEALYHDAAKGEAGLRAAVHLHCQSTSLEQPALPTLFSVLEFAGWSLSGARWEFFTSSLIGYWGDTFSPPLHCDSNGYWLALVVAC